MTLNQEILAKERMTCAITNKPLEKPAHVWFIQSKSNEEALRLINSISNTHSISFETREFKTTNKLYFMSKQEVEPRTLRLIWSNFKRTLRPKFKSNWDYLFFEIDTKDTTILNTVIEVYDSLNLPLYYHESFRGYHFLSVRPIATDVYNNAITALRKYNPDWPDIAIRIKANKYENEKEYYNRDCILTPNGKKHSDTEYLRKWIREENFVKIGERYITTWYSLDNKKGQKDVWGLEENDV